MCYSPRTLTVGLTGGSDYFVLTFKLVVEHIHKIALEKRRRRRYANPALEIIHTLARKISFPFVDAVWINSLLKSAAWGNVGDETFTTLLRLSALRKEEDAAADLEVPPGQDIDYTKQGEADPQSPGGTVRSEDRTPEYALFDLVLRNIKIRGEEEDGWQDDAVYGGLTAIRRSEERRVGKECW